MTARQTANGGKADLFAGRIIPANHQDERAAVTVEEEIDAEIEASTEVIDTGDELAAWLLFTNKITPGRFVAIYRELARRLAGLLEAGETVLVHIDPDYPEAVRLAGKLGFHEDGEEQFDDGRCMIRMVASA